MGIGSFVRNLLRKMNGMWYVVRRPLKFFQFMELSTMSKFITGDRIFIAYVIVFIFTFGYAYNRCPDTETGYFGGQPYTIHNGVGTKSVVSLFSALGWPLYWSVQAQKTGK